MTKAEFLGHLDEIMEQEPGTLKPGEALKDVPKWDSMTVVQFIAFADEEFNLAIPSAKLLACTTVDDLAALLSPHVTG
jgi:acyl carrier protein